MILKRVAMIFHAIIAAMTLRSVEAFFSGCVASPRRHTFISFSELSNNNVRMKSVCMHRPNVMNICLATVAQRATSNPNMQEESSKEDKELESEANNALQQADKIIVSRHKQGDIKKEEEEVGNLVADDEWMGLTMELAELLRVAVIEDVKKTTRDFTGKDQYKVGKSTNIELCARSILCHLNLS